MVRHEILINGKPADLAASPNITLNFKTPVMKKLSNMEAAHSFTISLPKTVNNSRIFDSPEIIGHDSTLVGRYFTARYYRNGIDILGPCQAYILSVGESYDICLVQKIMAGMIAKLKEAGNIAAFIEDIYPHSNGNIGRSGNLEYGNRVNLPSGRPPSKANLLENWLLPNRQFYVLVYYAWKKVARQLGFDTATVRTPMTSEEQSAIRIPYNDIKTTPQPETETFAAGSCYPVNMSYQIDRGRVGYYSKIRSTIYTSFYNMFDYSNADVKVVEGAEKVTITYNLQLNYGASMSGKELLFEAVKPDASGRSGRPVAIFSQKFVETGRGVYNVSGAFDADLSGLSSFFFAVLSGTANDYDYRNGLQTAISGTIVISPKNTPDATGNGETLDFVQDFPQIKTIDLLDFVNLFWGCWPKWDPATETVSYGRYTELSQTVDWTGKLLSIDKVEFRYEGLSRSTRFRWKEDKANTAIDLPANDTGEISVDDETIEAETDFYTAPFADTVDGYGLGWVPQVEVDGGVKFNKTEPRLLWYAGGSTSELTTDERLKWQYRLDTFWGDLAAALHRPKVVTAKVRLLETDLLGLEWGKAVAFRQLGKRFMLLEVKTSSDSDICEVKFLQL